MAKYRTHDSGGQLKAGMGQAAVEYFILAAAAVLAALWLWNATPQLKTIWNGEFNKFMNNAETNPGGGPS